jgi:multicomponent Na+:H+ antiporter subunit A
LSDPALHIAVILSPFLLLPLVGWLATRRAPLPLLLASIPAALTAYFGYTYLLLIAGAPFTVTATWAPALGLSLSFYFDGLSTLFAILIALVGTVIVVYATGYLEHHEYRGRFFVALFAFMGSML